jgi:hypothetical protein
MSRKTYHGLVTDAEVFNGIDDVWVLLAAGVAVGTFHFLPGIRILGEAEAGQHGHEQSKESLHDCGCSVYAGEMLSIREMSENSAKDWSTDEVPMDLQARLQPADQHCLRCFCQVAEVMRYSRLQVCSQRSRLLVLWFDACDAQSDVDIVVGRQRKHVLA